MSLGSGEQVTLQGLLMACLVMGLFITIIALALNSLSGSYDTGGYEETSLYDLDTNRVQYSLDELNPEAQEYNVSAAIQEYENMQFQMDENWWDFLSGVWSKIIGPLQRLSKTIRAITSVWSKSAEILHIPVEVTGFIVSLLVVLVVVGIIMIKFLGGKEK